MDLPDAGREPGAGETLMDGERDLHVFLDAVDDMVVVATPDGRIVHANPALTKKLGYDSAEIRSMPMLDLHPPEVRAEAESIYAAMWRGERNTYPLPLQTRSGALLPVETRVWFGRWNGADCVFGICKDLTAEQEALQRFERLFRHNPALMAVSDLPERRFTDVNDAWLKTLGYAREEVLGRTSEELGLAVDPDEQRAVGAQLQAHGRVGDVELTVRRRDGTILDGLFFGEISESQGHRYFLTVMIDQTERRHAEEALLLQSQKTETVERLAAEIAHDFDDLAAIIGAQAAVVGDELRPGTPGRAAVAELVAAARRGAELAGQLRGVGGPQEIEG